MGKAKPHRNVAVDTAASKTPDSALVVEHQISDLLVRAERIRHFAEIDLGLDELPSRREDLVALSIRMDAAFRSLCDAVCKSIAEEHQEIPRDSLETILSDLALNFIERYGVLAFFSTCILEILWQAQRPKCGKGPKRLRQVGQKLAIFSLAAKGRRPRKNIDISFKLNKRNFVAELEQLSRQLGRSESDEPWADQLLGLVRMGEYQMLKLNLTLLEQFLQSQETNPDLNAKNAASADRLAQYGIGKELGEKREPSLTPDWFFYTWIAWTTNKTRKTVRREVQTAETRLKRMITPTGVTKNR